jgi:hypothetical protein
VRVVANIPPENIIVVEKATMPNMALRQALQRVRQQVRQQPNGLNNNEPRPEQDKDRPVYVLSVDKIYNLLRQQTDRAELLAIERANLATRLMLENDLEEAAAYQAANQILKTDQNVYSAED